MRQFLDGVLDGVLDEFLGRFLGRFWGECLDKGLGEDLRIGGAWGRGDRRDRAIMRSIKQTVDGTGEAGARAG